MQIHELNNYNGTLDSSTYLAVDNGSDTGKVSTTELLAEANAAVSQLDTFLNGRIDNIIAGGEAPSASEIVDARYGADGVTYPSLGAAIRDQVTDLKSDLVNLSFTNGLTKFIRELYVIGDLSDRYHVHLVRKEPNGLYGYRIAIADSSNNIVSYLYNVTEEPRNPVYIPEYNNSGISAYAVLNWDNIEDSEDVYNIRFTDNAIDVTKNKIIFESINKAKYDPFIDISVPSVINAFVGDTLQMYYKGMFKCVNPYNYDIKITCDIGSQYPRYFELTPLSNQIGSHNFSIEVLDNNGKLLGSKSSVIKVSSSPVNPQATKNILCIGASCTQNGEWVGEFKRRLSEDYGISNANFVGRMNVNNVHLEATGGYSWHSYYQVNDGLYKFFFDSEHLPSVVNVGNEYTNNGHTFKVTEINIPTTDGGGYISCTGDGFGSTTGNLVLSSGVGDSTLTYYKTSYSGNPFAYNGVLNIQKYVNDYCGGKVDVIYTELFVNETTPYNSDQASLFNNMKTFCQTIHNALPNAKIVLGMPYMPDEKGGIGSNYHATGGFSYGYGIKTTFLNYMLSIEKFLSDNKMSYVSLVNWTNEFDSENDFVQTNKKVNVRSNATEVFGTNGIHPTNIGYYQMADSCVRHFVANYCQ